MITIGVIYIYIYIYIYIRDMKKIKILTLLLLIAVFSLDAQTPEVTVGRNQSPVSKLEKRKGITQLEYVDANEIITSEYGKLAKVFSVYDYQTMNLTETFQLKLDKINGLYMFRSKYIFHSDKVTTFFSNYDNSTNKNTIYGKITDRQGNNIVKLTKLMQFSSKSINKLGRINTYQSPDKSKIMYLRNDINGFVPQGDKVNIGVFDYDLNKIIIKELEFPKKYGLVRIKQVILTNEGKISFIVNVNFDKLFYDVTENYLGNYKIFVLDKDQEDFVEVTGLETDKFLSNCKGFVSNDSSHLITYSGTYKKGGDAPDHKTKTIDGFYTIILNTENWEVKKQYYNELNDKLQKKIIAQNQKFKGYKDHEFEDLKDIRNLFFKSVVFNPNGSLTIYCEFEKWRFKDNSINLYLYGQIVIFELDMTGKLSNTTVIPKAQAMIPDANLGRLYCY
jgi:hypothetical protein